MGALYDPPSTFNASQPFVVSFSYVMNSILDPQSFHPYCVSCLIFFSLTLSKLTVETAEFEL